MAKFRVLTEPPPMPRGDEENQLMELRDYLTRLTEELEFLLTHLEAENIDDTTFQKIQGMIPKAYTGLPPMDGEASGGSASAWARGDHRHPTDSSRAAASALSAHVGNTANPHSVTKAQVGLGNVDNVQQYSASNPPPIPTPGQVGAIPATEKGSANGVAELDANGMVPSAQLPSYVDDVLEYASSSAFPATGESGKIYVALDTNKTYRWSGSAYVEISESLALGETSATAYRGDRGKTAYDHSQTAGNPHGTTAVDVGAQPSVTASGILKGDGLGGVSAATAGTDYQTPLVAGTDYATPGMIPSVPDPSDATPQDLGTAAAGSSGDYSRADHVHALPDAEDIPYDNTVSGLMATDVQNAIDEIAQGGGGGGTAAAAVSYNNTGSGLTATNVQDAIDEVYGDIPAVPSISTATPQMDGTAAAGSTGDVSDAGHVHPSDTTKADKTDLAEIQATGSTNTTGSKISAGTLFYLNGTLVRAKQDIASGAAYTLNTNYEAVTVGGQLSRYYAETGDYTVTSGVLRFQGTSPVELGATVICSIIRNDNGTWNQYVAYPRVLAKNDLAFYFRKASDGSNAPNGTYTLSFLIINP